MVCVPCFIVPVLLFLWHKFIQPYVLRFWNPWAVKDEEGNVKTEFPFKCEGGVCVFSRKKDATGANQETTQSEDKDVNSTTHPDRIKAE